MALTAADVLIETIQDWGVDVVFGLPGDGINGLMEALRKRREQVRFIQVRHEEAAALMACGYAKFTGKLGVCLATSGPGGIHLLNGFDDAALDGQPVLAITGMAYHDLIGTHTQQDVALDRLFMDVAKYNERIMGPSHVENVAHLACRTALAYRGVAHITFPVDIQEMEACDTLLMVGTSFPYIEFLPKPGQARGVHIELDPMRIGLRYPVEVGLVGDSARTLQALLPLLGRKADRGFLETAQEGMKGWHALMEDRATRADTPMKPQVLARELGRRLRSDAIVACDSGTIATWWARNIPVRRGQMHSLSGNLATMAAGLPYAIAAQAAYPERQVVAFVGDGGFSMLMAELATCVKYQLPVKIVIAKNNTLGQIKWEQIVFLGNPEYGCELQPIDFALFARSCGAAGFTIENPADCGRMLEEALATPGPVVVQGVVDPSEPPLPARVTLDQAAKFARSLLRGEPNSQKIALTVLADRIRELV